MLGLFSVVDSVNNVLHLVGCMEKFFKKYLSGEDLFSSSFFLPSLVCGSLTDVSAGNKSLVRVVPGKLGLVTQIPRLYCHIYTVTHITVEV